MKSIIIFFALFLTIGLANAQTEEQTLEWLNAKVSVSSLFDVHGNNTSFSSEYCINPTSASGNTVLKTANIIYSKIKTVSYRYNPEKDLGGGSRILESHQIVLSGDFKEYTYNYDGKLTETSEIHSTNFAFKPNIEKEEIMKIMKAIKHIATLKGAKLVDDDLF